MGQVDLKKAGLKATVPRIRILEILEHNDQRRIAEKAGFSMTDHSLYIYGVCPKCGRS